MSSNSLLEDLLPSPRRRQQKGRKLLPTLFNGSFIQPGEVSIEPLLLMRVCLEKSLCMWLTHLDQLKQLSKSCSAHCHFRIRQVEFIQNSLSPPFDCFRSKMQHADPLIQSHEGGLKLLPLPLVLWTPNSCIKSDGAHDHDFKQLSFLFQRHLFVSKDRPFVSGE